MGPPEKRKGDPRQGRPSITASINGRSNDSSIAITTPDLAAAVADALGRGLVLGGGRYQLRLGRLVPEAGP